MRPGLVWGGSSLSSGRPGLDAGECGDPVLASCGLSSKPGRGGKGGCPPGLINLVQ